MKRKQLFEFEDYQWFPDWLRNSITRLIIILMKLMGIGEVISSHIESILKEKNLNQIVDLGSGAGGAMPEVLNTLNNKPGLQNIKLILTDFYPGKEIVARFNQQNNPNIHYQEEPLNALNLTNAPYGLKTMINCFHHLNPQEARNVLESAEENQQPIFIYELADNKIPFLIWLLFLPLSLVILMLMVWFMTPFIRPVTWRQIIFTYLIPIIPIVYAWDGQASLPRIYSPNDMKILLKGLGNNVYSWKVEYAMSSKNKKMGIYTIGMPVEQFK